MLIQSLTAEKELSLPYNIHHMVYNQDNQRELAIDLWSHNMLYEHDYEEKQVHRINVGEAVKFRANPLLPLYPMVDIGINVHLVDPNLIEELLDILTFIWWRFFFLGLLFLPVQVLHSRLDLRRFRKRVILLNAISWEPEGRSAQVCPQAHLSKRYLWHHLVPLSVLLLLFLRNAIQHVIRTLILERGSRCLTLIFICIFFLLLIIIFIATFRIFYFLVCAVCHQNAFCSHHCKLSGLTHSIGSLSPSRFGCIAPTLSL